MMNDDNDRTMVRTREMPHAAAGATANSVNVLPQGTRLGEFEVVNLIGEGGFGIVYLAYDHSLERHVALKEYMPSGLATRTTTMAVTVKSQHNAGTFTAGLKSFINEARLLAQFDSPSLVKVHRFWEANGTAYMVMPFYQGITLKQALKERRIQPTEHWIRLLLADLFDAIETIHRAQCFHRDIAPDNILLLEDGRPLLLDFGAARRVIGDLTQCLTVILKPGFAPIEQYADIAGLRQGAWTDIYALAAVVYYLIGGKAPPPAVARIVHDEMVPARQIGKGRYSDSFLAVIDKALAVKPEHRYQSIADLRHALDLVHTAPRVTPHGMSTATTPRPDDGRTVRLGDADLHAANDVRPSMRPGHGTRKPPPPPPQNEATGFYATSRPAYAYPPRRKGKPAWLIGAVVLAAGVASGVTYWKMHSPASDTAVASYGSSPGEIAPQSSGSSEVPERETPERASGQTAQSAQSTQPAAPAPTPAAPVQPTPASPPIASSVPARPSDMPALSPEQSERKQTAPAMPQLSAEDELWHKASTADKPRAYQNYLQHYPRGRYAAIAKLRLDSLQPKQAATTPNTNTSPSQQETAPKKSADAASTPAKPKAVRSTSPDEEAWDTAAAINEVPAYEAYLSKYPRGQFAAVAKDRLASLKPAEQKTAAEEPAAPPQPAKPPVHESAAAAPAATPSMANKQASINPTPAPAAPTPHAAPSDAASAQPPAASTSPVPLKKTIRVADQTLIGDFTADPKTGVISGKGKIAWADGNQFEGTLVRGRKEGKGEFIWANGQRYTGDWAHDQPNGKGTIVFPNGNRYVGEVKDGKPDGRGVMRFKDGDVHEGTWVHGKSNGMGRYTWANGSYWEGEFRNDQRTDNGKIVFSEKAQNEANAMAAAARAGQASGASAASDGAAGK
jgi:serine/threonine protein kinase